MENAVKALEMAAGVLLALIILGALVFAYQNLSEEKQIQADVEAEKQATDFNSQYEEYNKNGLYGNELLSLANKMVNYNIKEAEAKGYAEINMSVKITNGTTNIPVGTYNQASLTQKYSKLTNDISVLGKTKLTGSGETKTIVEWSKKSSKTINIAFAGSSGKESIENYKALVEEQSDFTRKKFNCTNVEYDKNGRITLMKFEETY